MRQSRYIAPEPIEQHRIDEARMRDWLDRSSRDWQDYLGARMAEEVSVRPVSDPSLSTGEVQ